ncbi:elongation factor Ts [Rhodobium orientis]|uniref:Elongation factor Ts n=1 Tax=Rhodobium orientis TaxID=34017 RepID=A0A327JQB3_9HYPH|nr:translation elongation factor Ts [Rhodobium orientis]MBB4302440.1 elongation factor Ts [Rhodobium orientis]MBK5949289.1 translation elongation factor Ts [Rhodobium orientis]RAI28660.1 elongation factor Ts [Rhodobium orientis]
MSISATQVKELREKTGAGMMDCKKALMENDGDMEAAIDWLRTKGLAKAAKKAGRVASEGLVGVATDGAKSAIVEINSETDFVARNDGFQKLVRDIAETALTVGGDRDATAAATYPGKSHSVDDELREQIATIGENMTFRRAAGLAVDAGVISSYVHNAIAPGLGKIGVIVAMESTGDAEAVNALGRQIAMHVAASNPLAVTPDEVDADVAARERAVYSEQARESGKPENIIEKMVEGRMRKFFEEVALLKQPFVVDPDNTVEKAVEAASKEIGAPIKVAGFVRFEVGEGVDKKDDDFAAEVQAMAGGN